MHMLDINLSPRLSIRVFQGAGSLGTRTWPSAIGLAQWIAASDENLAGLQVLECGAGTGLVSLALASRGASVLATDVDNNALRLVEMAAKEQGLTAKLRTATYDICSAQPLPQCDILVAADLTYSEKLADACARRCDEVIRAGGRAVIADPRRPFRHVFHESLKRACSGTYSALVRTAGEAGDFDMWRHACSTMSSGISEQAVLMLHIEAEEEIEMSAADLKG